MKIAYLTQPYPPMISGASLMVQFLAQGMAARGHEVLVMAASETGEESVRQEGGMTVHRFASKGNPVRAEQRFFPRPTRAMYSRLAAFRPDVIHLHEPLVMAMVAVAVSRRLGVPFTFTTHQLPGYAAAYLPDVPGMRAAGEGSLWAYCRWLHDQSGAFISPTATIARMIEAQAGFHPVVISNGMDLDRFHPAPVGAGEREAVCRAYGLDPSRPVILHVGRLEAEKNVRMVVQAAARAMKHTDAQLLIAGDGCERAALAQLVGAYGVADRTCFAGFVDPNGILPALYRSADVFVTASEIETQGLVLLEAMASGLPVVAVRATCVPEVVHDGSNGYLVPPGEAEAMAERIADVLACPVRAAEMGAAGRRVASMHSRVVTLDRHERLYQRLAAEPRPVTVGARLRERIRGTFSRVESRG